jgi:hypothetical protein
MHASGAGAGATHASVPYTQSQKHTKAATMDRFDKFTDRARKVLTLAQDEAQRFNHNYIGTEHLLLGLVREGEGVAARVLENMNVELSKVRTAVEFIIGRGDRPVVGEVGLTPRAKRVIELAIDEARRLGHNYIGTEHLLLGLVREGEGIAAGVLESLGVNLDKVRHQVIHVLSQSSSAAPAPETKRPSKTPTLDQLGINLTDLARAGKLDPSSAARRRSSGSSRSCPAARRTTRRSSASRASARRPSPRGSPIGSCPATSPRRSPTSGCSPWTSARWWPARSTAASSRSA